MSNDATWETVGDAFDAWNDSQTVLDFADQDAEHYALIMFGAGYRAALAAQANADAGTQVAPVAVAWQWKHLDGDKWNTRDHRPNFALTERVEVRALGVITDAPAAPAQSLAKPVVKWERRMRPLWDKNHPWSEWEECSQDAAIEWQANSPIYDWEYEVRALAVRRVKIGDSV